MAIYYMDTSAIARYYVSEVGSAWIQGLVAPTAGNIIVSCGLLPVEFFSLLERKQREGTVTPADAAIFRAQFLQDAQAHYLLVAFDENILTHARQLVLKHPLKTLDALHLASALEFSHMFAEPMTFVAADKQLLTAAQSKGFPTDNPRNYH